MLAQFLRLKKVSRVSNRANSYLMDRGSLHVRSRVLEQHPTMRGAAVLGDMAALFLFQGMKEEGGDYQLQGERNPR